MSHSTARFASTLVYIYRENQNFHRLAQARPDCVVRRAAYPKLIQFNGIKYVGADATSSTMESPSHQGTEKTDCSV